MKQRLFTATVESVLRMRIVDNNGTLEKQLDGCYTVLQHVTNIEFCTDREDTEEKVDLY